MVCIPGVGYDVIPDSLAESPPVILAPKFMRARLGGVFDSEDPPLKTDCSTPYASLEQEKEIIKNKSVYRLTICELTIHFIGASSVSHNAK
jgi:hypothetical protein